MLEINELKKSFGKKTVLDRLSISLKPGVWALFGPNGSGKSTLLRILWGEMRADSGQVLWEARAIQPASREWKACISVVPDDDALIEGLSPKENLRLWGILNNLPRAEIDERTDVLLKLLKLEQAAGARDVGELSRGNRKRLSIAMALLRDASLYLMDEPFASLDAESIGILISLMKTLGQKGKTVIYSSHLPETIKPCADGFVSLADGQASLMDISSFTSLKESPAEEPKESLRWLA